MCCRFTLNIHPEVLAKTFDLAEIPQYELRYNIAPGQNIVVVRRTGNRNKLDTLTWGLTTGLPAETDQPVINIPSESIGTDPLYAAALNGHRCIIPASGFYDWLPAESQKQPFYIRLANSSAVGFAGIWGSYRGEDGCDIETCAILTTEANELVLPINDRMPVILQPEQYNLWLDCTTTDTELTPELYTPCSADLMVAYPVPGLVNNLRFDSASCIIHM